MWFCPSRACRSPAPQNPWAFAPGRWAWETEWPASQAGFPPQGGQNPPAHSILVWRAIGSAQAGLAGQYAAAAPAGPAWAPGRAARPGLAAQPAPAPGSRRDRAELAEPADSMGLPRPFCLWILKYSDHVWNVFSCCFQPLPITFAFTRNTIPGAGAANLVHSITYSPIAGTPS